MGQLVIFTVRSNDATTHQCILSHFTSQDDSGRTPPPESKGAEWVQVSASSKRHPALGYVFGKNSEASIVLPAVGGVSGKQFGIKPTPTGIDLTHMGTYKTRCIILDTGYVVKLEVSGDKRSILDGQQIKILDPVSLDIILSKHSAEEQQLKEKFCAMLAGEVTTLNNLDLSSTSSTLPPRDDDGAQWLNRAHSRSERNNVVLIQGSEDTDLVGSRPRVHRRWVERRTRYPDHPPTEHLPGHRRIARKPQRGSPASRDTSAGTSRSISRPPRRRVRFAEPNPSIENTLTIESTRAQSKAATVKYITQLDTKDLRCRLLFWPGDGMLRASSGDWMTLDRIGDAAQLRPVKCLAVAQTPNSPRCKLKHPFACRFIYHTSSDAVEFHNVSSSYVLVDSVPSRGSPQRVGTSVTIDLTPGAWAFTDQPGNRFQVLIFPRRYSIEIFDASMELIIPAGDSVAGLEESYTLQISEFAARSRIRFLEKVFETERYLGYKVYHSDYQKAEGDFVLAKIFKWDRPFISSAAMEWERECSALGMLPQSNVIISLLGADARLRLLVFQYIPAVSLDRWKGSPSAMFTGSMSDVERIQKDMTEALQVLGSVGMRHNDIRPENILYSKESGATLIGFHHACTPGNEWDTGSSFYSPPEFLEDRKEGKSDTFSFGIAMAFFLCVIPLPGSQETPSVLDIKYPRQRRYVDNGLWTTEMSKAKKRYEKWLKHVTTNACRMLKQISQWSHVPGMLAPDPDKRTSLEELEQLQQLQQDPSPWRRWKDEHDPDTGERRDSKHAALSD